MKDIWKKFDEEELTHSSIHHLMAIHTLTRQYGYARGTDIADLLDITRGSVSITIGRLLKKGYVEKERNKFYKLSPSGIEVVNSVLSKRLKLKEFFEEVLLLPYEISEVDACKIEHLLSQQTMVKLTALMGCFLSKSADAKKFRKASEEFGRSCKGTKNCKVCELPCFFAGTEQNRIEHNG